MSIKTIIFCTLSCILLAACTNTKQQLKDEIDSKEKLLYENKNGRINTKLAREVIIHYRYYAEKFPDDSLSVEYLFKAGELANSMQLPQPALGYLNRLMNKYPNYKNAPYALFMQGMIYDDQLKDTANARKIYQQVIVKYPESQLAKDAEASIYNLGKSVEELVREFEKKQAASAKK